MCVNYYIVYAICIDYSYRGYPSPSISFVSPPSCNSSSLKTLRKQAPPPAASHALGQLLDTGGTSASVKWWADHETRAVS